MQAKIADVQKWSKESVSEMAVDCLRRGVGLVREMKALFGVAITSEAVCGTEAFDAPRPSHPIERNPSPQFVTHINYL